MHVASSYSTRFGVSELWRIAPVGHTRTHAASSHCWHIIGTEKPSRSQVKTWTFVAPGRNAASCWKEHASSQFRHPVHLSGWIIRILAIYLSLRVDADLSGPVGVFSD